MNYGSKCYDRCYDDCAYDYYCVYYYHHRRRHHHGCYYDYDTGYYGDYD